MRVLCFFYDSLQGHTPSKFYLLMLYTITIHAPLTVNTNSRDNGYILGIYLVCTRN